MHVRATGPSTTNERSYKLVWEALRVRDLRPEKPYVDVVHQNEENRQSTQQVDPVTARQPWRPRRDLSHRARADWREVPEPSWALGRPASAIAPTAQMLARAF